jgi:hypothetical protein
MCILVLNHPVALHTRAQLFDGVGGVIFAAMRPSSPGNTSSRSEATLARGVDAADAVSSAPFFVRDFGGMALFFFPAGRSELPRTAWMVLIKIAILEQE